MKKNIYLFLSGFLLFSACQQDVLDKVPLDMITENALWNDPVLIERYLIQCYAQTSVFTNDATGHAAGESTIFDLNHGEDRYGPHWINGLADEGTWNWRRGTDFNFKRGGLNINGGLIEYWELPYKTIRYINEFLEKVPNSPLEIEVQKVRLAEARFIRAFNYFAMVKRYGGVPLITKVQQLDDPIESLYPARDSEQTIYDFIISEMDEISNDLPDKNPQDQLGRVTKYTALALKCRAALYAGSVAQFGKIQLGGLLGFPAESASSYYQKSYDAANAIINSGEFALYNDDADKIMNFRNLFLVETNSEVIFARRHDDVTFFDGGNGWMYDYYQAPINIHNAGNKDAPYLEMAESFEYVDGTPGQLDRVAIQEGLWTMDELWGNRDPRFYATLYTQGTKWKWMEPFVDFHNGIILPDGTIQITGSYEGVEARGRRRTDNSFGTGFGVMKYLDEDTDISQFVFRSKTDYLVFRYGEILLNYAEAAFELGKSVEALEAINQIRSRAGIISLESVTREKIRHERKVELAYEGHRYWDLRRWRTAESDLSMNWSGIRYILDYTTRKYQLSILENIDGTTPPPRFYERNYYFPITLERTGINPNLIENPGYQ